MSWIATYTGRKFYPLDPRVEDIDIVDIAHALSMKCRFTGHCRDFYSVAQHSVLVSRLVPPEHALWGLMHDAAEAYLPDVARPIKALLVGFSDIEARVMRCVAERFSMPADEPACVKAADTRLLLAEKRDLMPPGPDWGEWADAVVDVPCATIHAWTQRAAEDIFLRRFADLARRAEAAC